VALNFREEGVKKMMQATTPFNLRVLTLASLGLILVALSCQTKSANREAATSESSQKSAESRARTGEDRQPLKLPLRDPKIVVKKDRRQLLLFSGGNVVRTYNIGLGLSPIGDKVREGDRRTPEGDFHIFTKNAKSQFYLSLGLSYPNATHAQRGLRDGLITQEQYNAIIRALRAGKGPLQNTPLGGDIYIHGNGAQSDWTWGCVALENEDIRELFGAVNVGTSVKIEP
jgi:murein L,D-transpeptidase YafK